jgi:two-component system, LytTR family, response regulator
MMPVIKNKIIADEKPFRVGLSTADGMIFVMASTIIRCEALNNYTRFYFTNERPMVVCRTLRYFEEQLTSAHFIRIHRGEMINKNCIANINRSGMLWLTDGSRLTISRRRKRKVFNAVAC